MEKEDDKKEEAASADGVRDVPGWCPSEKETSVNGVDEGGGYVSVLCGGEHE